MFLWTEESGNKVGSFLGEKVWEEHKELFVEIYILKKKKKEKERRREEVKRATASVRRRERERARTKRGRSFQSLY